MIKPFETLQFTDDYMFCKVLTQAPDITKPLYTFKTMCEQDVRVDAGDERTLIVVNAQGLRDSEKRHSRVILPAELERLIGYIRDDIVTDEFTSRIEKEVIRIREAKEWGMEYMTFEMKLREYEDRGREEGRSEGEERVLKLMKRLLDEGKIDEARLITEDAALREAKFAEYRI